MSSLPSPDRDSAANRSASAQPGEFADLFAQLDPAPPRSPVEDAGLHLGSWLSSALDTAPEPTPAPRDLEFERHQAELLARGKARGVSRPSSAASGPRARPDTPARSKPATGESAQAARPTPPGKSELDELFNLDVGQSGRESGSTLRAPAADLSPQPGREHQASPLPRSKSVDEDAQNFELVDRISAEISRLPALAGLSLHFSAVRGQVTVVGDLRSDYERQLVRHFVRSVRGVTEMTDLMRVPTEAAPPKLSRAAPAPGALRRSGRSGAGRSLALPPNAKWVAGLILLSFLGWTGLSFAKRGDGLPQPQPAKGQVVLPGGSLAGALLVLHPTQPGMAARPRATLKEDGRFELTTHSSGDGAPEGEYIVTTVLHQLQMVDGEPVPGPNQLPPRFSKPETSPLRVSIQRGTNDLPPLRLSP